MTDDDTPTETASQSVAVRAPAELTGILAGCDPADLAGIDDTDYLHDIQREARKQLNALPTRWFLFPDEETEETRAADALRAKLLELAHESLERARYLSLNPPRRPILSFPDCPDAQGYERVHFWHPVPFSGEDFLCYERWTNRDGFHPTDMRANWPTWRRFIAPIRACWWPDFRDIMRAEIYGIGKRELSGLDWNADLTEVDELIEEWARCGHPIDGDFMERQVQIFLDPKPAQPGPLAIESDPWAAHLNWVLEWSGGATFTVAAMLNAVQRDPDGVGVPGINPGDPAATVKAGKAYAREAGKRHAGIEIVGAASAHGTRTWQVVAETGVEGDQG